MSDTTDKNDFWLEKWKTGDTRFNLERPHSQLIKHLASLPPTKIMVPLCGKSVDLLWLRQQGHDVVGVELSPIACEAFFKENGLPFEIKKSGSHTVYQGERVALYCGDFFTTPKEAWTRVTALYDRAALIALPQELRTQYAAHIQQNWPATNLQNQTMLLITIDYPQEAMSGPPFSAPESEVQKLYGTNFKVERIAFKVDAELSERIARSGAQVTECVFKLTRHVHQQN